MKQKKKESEITRRNFIKTSAIAGTGISLTGTAFTLSGFKSKLSSRRKPHIIYIIADQYRGDCIGIAGNKAVITPNIDSLAKDGVWFKNGFTATPSCTPARAGLLTGLSPWHHGMLGYGRVAEKYKYELPRMLREAGYYTFGIGKMHWHPQKTLHGFHSTLVDESGRVETPDFISDYRKWFKKQSPDLDPDATGIGWNEHRAGVYALSEELHPTYWTGQVAVDQIKDYNREEPLLLKISFARPHSPYDPPQRFLDMYENVDIPEPFVGDWCEKFADYPMTKSAAFGDFGAEYAVNSRKYYNANITFIDEQIGLIIKALKEKGMYENALIMFTADHGDMLGDHYHWRKTYAYQGSANIPYIMKWPQQLSAGIPKGSHLDYPVELRDFLPTFLDAAGAQIPEDMDGASLLKLIKEKNPGWREYIDLEHSRCYQKENYWAALTDGKTKYIWFFFTGEEQLFDIGNDPGELHELANNPEYSKTLELWRSRMVEHLSERGNEWVKEGELIVRTENLLYSPHYPGNV